MGRPSWARPFGSVGNVRKAEVRPYRSVIAAGRKGNDQSIQAFAPVLRHEPSGGQARASRVPVPALGEMFGGHGRSTRGDRRPRDHPQVRRSAVGRRALLHPPSRTRRDRVEPLGGFFPIAVDNGGVTVGCPGDFLPVQQAEVPPSRRDAFGPLGSDGRRRPPALTTCGWSSDIPVFAPKAHGFFAWPRATGPTTIRGSSTRLYDVTTSVGRRVSPRGTACRRHSSRTARRPGRSTRGSAGDQFIPRHINGPNYVAGTVALRNPDSSTGDSWASSPTRSGRVRLACGLAREHRLRRMGRQHTATFVGEQASITGINDKGVITVSSADLSGSSRFDRFFASRRGAAALGFLASFEG